MFGSGAFFRTGHVLGTIFWWAVVAVEQRCRGSIRPVRHGERRDRESGREYSSSLIRGRSRLDATLKEEKATEYALPMLAEAEANVYAEQP
jgi:hypothetical protein